jgi:dTMP kinase
MLGKFISIEGPDGAGKSTQIKLLEEYLLEAGYEVILTREPGGTFIGEKIRSVLLDPENLKMNYKTEILLYAAARAQIVEEVIKPALNEGKIVICDRFVDSSFAYQGYGRGIDLEYIRNVNEMVMGDTIPKLTLIFDIDPEVGLDRVQARRGNNFTKDRIESEAIDFHKRVRNGFLTLAKTHERYRVIDSNQEIQTIHLEVKRFVEDIL